MLYKLLRVFYRVTFVCFFLMICKGAVYWWMVHPRIISLNVESESSRMLLDDYFWGEKLSCLNYVKGVEIYDERFSVERFKCRVDEKDPSWSRLEGLLKEKWDESYVDSEDLDEEMPFFKHALKYVDYSSGTIVYARSKKGSGTGLLLLREGDGRLTMYLWGITFSEEKLKRLRAH